MIEATNNSSVIKHVSAEEMDKTLKKIFDSVDDAIKANEQKISLENVDKTLDALFDAINSAHVKGPNAKLPDFKKILTSTH